MTRKRMRSLLAAATVLLLLLLLSYCAYQSNQSLEQHAAIPLALDHDRLLNLDDAVVTGFAGTTVLTAELMPTPVGKQAVEQTFIDVNGAAARIVNLRTPGFVWNGSMWAAPQSQPIRAGEVGQVFGIAIDGAAHPNVYLAATSVYGLNLVEQAEHDDDDDDDRAKKTDDDDDEAVPHRLHTGGPHAQWMAGQFGPGGGPTSVWKIDGRTGRVTQFAKITLNDEAGGPAALGNLAFDSEHHQLFVSDLSTGMIHRLDMAGRDLDHFDHGNDGRRAAGMEPVPYDGAKRARITDSSFNPESPATWGYAPASRRVWGLAVHGSRLYYAVADGHIWSIALDKDGRFEGSARKDIDLPAGNAPVSDIVFNRDGAMIVAQRAVIGTHFDYSPLAPVGAAHVYRFWPEQPDDPGTPSTWYQQPEEHAVGYARDNRNSSGGVDLAYGYKIDEKSVTTFNVEDCDDAILFTGTNLRGFAKTQDGFVPGGPLLLNGLQISPSRPVRGFNMPAGISYLVNYAPEMDSRDHSGSLGGVRVYRLPCTRDCPTPGGESFAVTSGPRALARVNTPVSPPGSPPPGNPPPGNPPNSGDCIGPCEPPCTGLDCPTPCVGTDCPCVGIDCTSPKVCMEVQGEAVCDPASGGWVYKITATDPLGLGIDTVSAYSRVPGVSVTNGPQISLIPPPGVIQLSGASPGQHVTIDVCGFNSADPNYTSGKPYDCCRQTLHVRVPRGVCKANEGPAQ